MVLHLLPLLKFRAHFQILASLSLFYKYYFGICSFEQAQLVPLHYSCRRSSYSDRLNDFCVTISRFYMDVYVNSFFPHTARVWNSLPIVYFPLVYDLCGYNVSFLVIPYLVVSVQSCMECIPIKKKNHDMERELNKINVHDFGATLSADCSIIPCA